MVEVILTHIPVECGVVDPYVDRFLDGFGKVMVFPSYNGECIRVGAMSWNVAMSKDGGGFFDMSFISLPKGPGCLTYGFLITHKLPTLVPIDSTTPFIQRIFILGENWPVYS